MLRNASVVTMVSQFVKDWTLLSYRIPREPSTPRIAVWRQLRLLGVVQIGDGLVGLPATAANRERLQWTAAKVLEADGEAIVWDAQPAAKRDGRTLADQLREARSLEYDQLMGEIDASGDTPTERTIAKWRRAWRAIDKRDYLDSPGREETRAHIAALAKQRNIEKKKART